MYVCLCNAVTDKAIRKVIQQHQPQTMKELRQHCPIGTDCGKCIRQAREILVEEQESMTYIIEVA